MAADPGAKESTRLSAHDWVWAALRAIASGGLAAVAVEPLAKQLGVTKGSFYAHFRNRDELVAAALDQWVRHGHETLAPFSEIDDPATRLRRLIDGMVAAGESGPPSVQLSLIGEAGDERVRSAVQRVDRTRLDLLARTYRELGVPPAQAEHRARIVYATNLGLLHLAEHNGDDDASDEQRAAFHAEAVSIFLPDDPGPDVSAGLDS
ncbi:AcrR family transcriptional regulator [Nocardia transvalensis]|uniref:AcrR family transcriptional regulator n=1 Tax=Nocardia transvalensis TaxID=37333 RepID=A0A7W9PFC4_9NOCA|nr:TetR/AcrR family transcriptional regulator [Nocardia transvalensis]MBB5915146.1 AcrR family transcriptional regulator [Nocardia transvalensis]